MIEQIRRHGEEHLIALLHLQRRRHRQVRLADAHAAAQEEPAVRLPRELDSGVVRLLGAGRRLEIGEIVLRERIEVRLPPQLLALPVRLFFHLAVALKDAAKIGVADRHVHLHPAGILADWAAVGRLLPRRRAVAGGRAGGDAEGGQDFADALHGNSLVWMLAAGWCKPFGDC